jgi:hypothetical protein
MVVIYQYIMTIPGITEYLVYRLTIIVDIRLAKRISCRLLIDHLYKYGRATSPGDVSPRASGSLRSCLWGSIEVTHRYNQL